ncbi:MAG: hypothetical protein HQM12_00965 [SAR324 cluster bacterium]|nr:hypothetical protein [SAR324 cluster bacterium]
MENLNTTTDRDFKQCTAEILSNGERTDTVIIQFSGTVTSMSLYQQGFQNKISTLVRDNQYETFVIDLMDAIYIDSGVLGMISNITKHRKKAKLVCLKNSLIYQVFEQMNLLKVLPCYNELNQALQAV